MPPSPSSPLPTSRSERGVGSRQGSFSPLTSSRPGSQHEYAAATFLGTSGSPSVVWEQQCHHCFNGWGRKWQYLQQEGDVGRPNGGGLEHRFPGDTLKKTRAKPGERKACDLENGDCSLEGREPQSR